MAKIAETYAERGDEPLFICDFSPPRGASHDNLRYALALDADWLSIPYNPGKSVYANSAMAAHSLSASAGKDVVFTIATRDTNILAAQSLLLGAALLGLENVVVVRGDDFTASQLHATKAVHDYTPTALIRSIAAMNAGSDFRGRALSAPTSFCIGATIDMARGVEAEVALTRRKVEAGAQFFITQPTFTPEIPLRFLEHYRTTYGEELATPVFFGVQILAAGGRSFGEAPQWVSLDLRAGRSGSDIAAQVLDAFFAAGLKSIYLLPLILPGGARDYDTAQETLRRFNSR